MGFSRFPLLKPTLTSVSTASLFSSIPSSCPSCTRSQHRTSTSRRLCTMSSNLPIQGLISGDHHSSAIVDGLLDYLNESWTQFHATAEAKRQLIAAGFQLLDENSDWNLQPGGRYFFTRNMSCLIAFAVGGKYRVGNGFHVVAAHTDSPCLKLKPRTASLKTNYLMVNVQTYGAGLWHTWFDRDLSVAGRVIMKAGDDFFTHELVKVKRPILRVPTLAIHLDRSVNTDGFKPNLESHLVPLLAMKLKDDSADKSIQPCSSKAAHHSLLLEILAKELDCKINEIIDIELNVCDTQPSCLGGGENEFIFSGRLDNLASCYCALRSLVDSCKSESDLADETAIRMVALFDNEEVGSNSVQGAGAPTMFQAMKRIVSCLANDQIGEGAFGRTIRSSFLVSADMAHGVHPNFLDKYEEHHRPELQKGLVIKHNANQRYATSSVTAFLFKEVAKIYKIPVQEFVVRNDMGCGSTIGPILASGVGIRTVDCGIPQLSMHSVREICGKEDVDTAYRHFMAFFRSFSTIDRKLSIDF
ncbi:probable aspartyl aminopeptidase [Phalaenopsis equestris]|uniref:probable aspartyl aminopeptidase n=1 Tax=Phalaenopsis equestris TaxID=78828 RepID=UPI0009E4A0FA|nr:probable aspartyl aminopeptidase [Phalaenopsis equestris]XP_020580799.1 probable aspartyl aminopeptidase [Phalaenopsis equestris]